MIIKTFNQYSCGFGRTKLLSSTVPRFQLIRFSSNSDKSNPNNNKLRKFFSDVKLGVVLGWKDPLLPPKLEKINNLWYIKIFRVLGILSIGCLWKINLSNNIIIFYVLEIIVILFYIYYTFMVFNMIKYYCKQLKEGKYIIKNSPVNPTGSNKEISKDVGK